MRTGSTPRSIRITDTSISADDIIDVVALLIAAAERNPTDCLSPVVTMNYAGTTQGNNAAGGYGAAPYDSDDDDGGPIRIGEDDDDDILYDDDYVDKKKKAKDGRKTEYKRTTSSGPTMITRIQNRLSKLFRDDESDRFDDEEEE